MKPAFAVSTRITSLPSAFSIPSAKSPSPTARSTQVPQITGPPRLFPAQRAVISPGSIKNPSPNAPKSSNHPHPPHPTDRVLSLTILWWCCSFLCIPPQHDRVLFRVRVPRRFWLCVVVFVLSRHHSSAITTSKR